MLFGLGRKSEKSTSSTIKIDTNQKINYDRKNIYRSHDAVLNLTIENVNK